MWFIYGNVILMKKSLEIFLVLNLNLNIIGIRDD